MSDATLPCLDHGFVRQRRRPQRAVMTTAPERLTDAELPVIEPIMQELAEMLDPRITGVRLRAALQAGARVRIMVLPRIDVDLACLARWIYARESGR